MIGLIINITIFILFFVAILYLIDIRKKYKKVLFQKTRNINEKIKKNGIYIKLEKLILKLEIQKVINKKARKITPKIIIIISVLLFVLAYILIYSLFKVKSTSLILSIPIIFIPTFVLKYILSKQKNRILENLPTYIVNLKNNVSNSGDIITAIQKTNVNYPLNIYIDKFNIRVKRGINIYEAFEKLKEEISINKIDSFISACQTCHLNGGDFTGILTSFSSIITKDNIQKEKLKESSYSSIITLFVMMLMNLFLIFNFVFKNKEYANIIRNTFGGITILNFTAITYLVIGYLILKIYRIGEE